MMMSNFTQVNLRHIKGAVPNVFKLGRISDSQPRMLFRMDQAFQKKVFSKYDRNLKKKMVQMDVKYKLGSSDLYVVTQLPVGTVVVVGKHFQRRAANPSLMVYTRQFQEMHNSKTRRGLRMPDQCGVVPQHFPGYNAFLPQIEAELGDLSADLRQELNLFLNEQLYFEFVTPHLLVYRQQEVEADFALHAEDPVFQYVMAKLYFFEGAADADWETDCVRRRLAGDWRRYAAAEELAAGGFAPGRRCAARDIFD